MYRIFDYEQQIGGDFHRYDMVIDYIKWHLGEFCPPNISNEALCQYCGFGFQIEVKNIHLSLSDAKNLKIGQTLYHNRNKNADGTPQRWKVNGKPKTWKTRPDEVRVPIKNGLRNYDYLTETKLDLVHL